MIKSKTNKTITIVAIDDHPLIHEAIRSLVSKRDDIAFVEQGSAGEHLFPLVAEYRPDIVILDLNMPHYEGGTDQPPESFRAFPEIIKLHREYPETSVIILSQHSSPVLVHGAMESGVKGYLLKDDGLSLKLPEAIDIVSNGGIFFSEEVRQELFEKRDPTKVSLLTNRQREIVMAIAKDLDASYAHHAAVLDIKESTLRNHLSKIYKTLDVTNLTAAIVRCIQLGIIPIEQEPQD